MPAGSLLAFGILGCGLHEEMHLLQLGFSKLTGQASILHCGSGEPKEARSAGTLLSRLSGHQPLARRCDMLVLELQWGSFYFREIMFQGLCP